MNHALTWCFDIEIDNMLIIFHNLKPLGDLRSHGVLHIWDDSFFGIFSVFVVRLQWAKKLGRLFLAVGGRSSMREWQFTAMLGDLHWHWVPVHFLGGAKAKDISAEFGYMCNCILKKHETMS